jgi:hypothetical protein
LIKAAEQNQSLVYLKLSCKECIEEVASVLKTSNFHSLIEVAHNEFPRRQSLLSPRLKQSQCAFLDQVKLCLMTLLHEKVLQRVSFMEKGLVELILAFSDWGMTVDRGQ